MQHIIKRQVIDLTLHKKLDAFSIQQTVSDYYYAKILPLLLQAFDAASSEEETITIDCLEIDIGTVGIKELEKGDWGQKIFKNITEQLAPISFGLNSQVKTVSKQRQLSIADQWLFYMRYGFLPWNVLEINNDWYKNVLEAFAAESSAIKKLRGLINNYPGLVKRIVAQHTESFLKALVETLTALSQQTLPQLINELVKIKSVDERGKQHSDGMQLKKTKQGFWEQILKKVASSTLPLNTTKITQLLVADNFSDSLNKKGIKNFMERNNINTTLNDEIVNESLPKKDFEIELNEDGIFVINAGVVLLHPFLSLFFSNLHLTKESDFVDFASHIKALNLLHYLATGNINPQEYELVVPKVLCAYPLEQPVDITAETSNEELEEAESLLLSAIGQWDILKGTSPNGLRESFLQRKGKLVASNGNQVLLVEQSSIDVLLDHLPWNLGIVKLPWMKDILKVEWR